ncbi:MAG: hypothetical protein J2P22_15050 [Nocardioides sp.]|nr:hypothetical protein [Nocardioides sp.]
MGEVERLGPATQTTIRDRLAGSRATIVPVLDLARDHAVDEPPAGTDAGDRGPARPALRLPLVHPSRQSLRPRPHHPIHPRRPGRATRPDRTHELAPLCRRHHRAKTARRWHYRRHGDGTYTWHGPHGSGYLVTPLGTRPLPPA